MPAELHKPARESIDLPALDAVSFLHPLASVVDVVHSLGRAKRKSTDKDYGYIIVPVADAAPALPEEVEALEPDAGCPVVTESVDPSVVGPQLHHRCL